MTPEAVAVLRQQANAVRAGVMATLMAVDAMMASLPAPPPPEPASIPRTLGSD